MDAAGRNSGPGFEFGISTGCSGRGVADAWLPHLMYFVWGSSELPGADLAAESAVPTSYGSDVRGYGNGIGRGDDDGIVGGVSPAVGGVSPAVAVPVSADRAADPAGETAVECSCLQYQFSSLVRCLLVIRCLWSIHFQHALQYQ